MEAADLIANLRHQRNGFYRAIVRAQGTKSVELLKDQNVRFRKLELERTRYQHWGAAEAGGEKLRCLKIIDL